MCRGFESRPCHQFLHRSGSGMPFTVYVLRSLRNGRHYTGFTSRPLERRLAEHNRGYPKGWSSRNRPFEVLYQEMCASEVEARARERFLKSGRGRQWLRAQVAGPSCR